MEEQVSRAFEEAQERRLKQQQDEHVARHLGISIEVLGDHPYEIEENSGDSADNEGVVYGWRVLWDDLPPEGVAVHGEEGSYWSDIQAGTDEPERDEEPQTPTKLAAL